MTEEKLEYMLGVILIGMTVFCLGNLIHWALTLF
jgi:hypothetical protein